MSQKHAQKAFVFVALGLQLRQTLLGARQVSRLDISIEFDFDGTGDSLDEPLNYRLSEPSASLPNQLNL